MLFSNKKRARLQWWLCEWQNHFTVFVKCRCNLVQCHLNWIVPFIRHYYWNGLFFFPLPFLFLYHLQGSESIISCWFSISLPLSLSFCLCLLLSVWFAARPSTPMIKMRNNFSFLFISLSLFVNASRCQCVVVIVFVVGGICFTVMPVVWHIKYTNPTEEREREGANECRKRFVTFQKLSGYHIIVYFIITIWKSQSFAHSTNR